MADIQVDALQCWLRLAGRVLARADEAYVGFIDLRAQGLLPGRWWQWLYGRRPERGGLAHVSPPSRLGRACHGPCPGPRARLASAGRYRRTWPGVGRP